MKLVEFTEARHDGAGEGCPVWLNPEQVVSVQNHMDGGSLVHSVHGFVWVAEAPDLVAHALQVEKKREKGLGGA